MRRRELIAALGGAALAWPRPIAAQQPGKVYRIGIMETTSPALNAANSPSDLPLEEPVQFELLVNFKTAGGLA